MLCNRCGQHKSQYSVISPPCIDTYPRIKLCPSCFQQGIDKGNIVWIGASAYGVCEDHETPAMSA
jgi:hypothetical protein